MSEFVQPSQHIFMLNRFPEELLLLIFQYFDERDLLAAEDVCKYWRQIIYCHDEHFWKPLTKMLWSKIEINRPDELNLLHRVQSLNLTKLKKHLIYIDLTRCVEKRDFQRMLLAKLLFSKKMQKELSGSDARFKGRFLHIYYPDWSLTMGVFKASYFFAKREVVRQTICISELCSIQWHFRFKHYDQMEEMSFASNFREDGTVYSEMNDRVYQWKVCR